MASPNLYYQIMGDRLGPVDSDEIRRLATAGTIKPDTLIQKGIDGKWVSADSVRGLFDKVGNVKPAPPPITKPSPQTASPTTGTTKHCPFCDEEIAIAAIKCKHCGEFLNRRVPVSDSATIPATNKQIVTYYNLLVVFVLLAEIFGIFALSAPIAAVPAILFIIVRIVFAVFLTRELFENRPLGFVLSGLMIVPVMGIVVLIWFLLIAIPAMRKRGIKVNLFANAPD